MHRYVYKVLQYTVRVQTKIGESKFKLECSLAKIAFKNWWALKPGGFYMVSENFMESTLAISLKIVKENWKTWAPPPDSNFAHGDTTVILIKL